jgi:hypothetical protein
MNNIHVYDFNEGESFQFVTLKDFLIWCNDHFDCHRHIVTTDYQKIKELLGEI